MNTMIEKLAEMLVVPVVVLEDAADAEKLAAETKNKEAAMRIKAKTNLDRAASLIVERIVNG